MSHSCSALAFTSPYLTPQHLHAYTSFTFAICHWDSKLRSSKSIHSPSIAEYRIILAVSAAPMTGYSEKWGVTCVFNRQRASRQERLMELMSSCLYGIAMNSGNWWQLWTHFKLFPCRPFADGHQKKDTELVWALFSWEKCCALVPGVVQMPIDQVGWQEQCFSNCWVDLLFVNLAGWCCGHVAFCSLCWQYILICTYVKCRADRQIPRIHYYYKFS